MVHFKEKLEFSNFSGGKKSNIFQRGKVQIFPGGGSKSCNVISIQKKNSICDFPQRVP